MIVKGLFHLLVFPGFLFAAVVGSFAAVLDRKVSARLQFRVGPPWRQSFIDVLKLFGKETVLIENSPTAVFVAAPLIALASLMLAAAIIGAAAFLNLDLVGDLILYVYLLLIFPVCLIVGAFSSRNVFASQGASREINLLIAYELPFFLSLLIPVIKSGYTLRLTEILSWQATGGPVIASASGVIGFVVAVLCIQAKMGLPPFDVAEAETELAGGLLIEYGGPLLGFWRIAHYMLYVILPLTLAVLFLGGVSGPTITAFLLGMAKYLGIVVLMILIRNTNPRVRTDSILRFFWRPMALIAATGVFLAIIGV